MEGTGITPVMDMNRGYGYGDGFGFGGGSGIWLFANLALMLGGNGFFGGNNLGYRPSTAEDVNNGFNFADLQDQNRDIINAINSGVGNAVTSVKDAQNALSLQLGDIKSTEQAILAKEQECCCATLRAIDGVNYNAAMNTASINANTTAQTQKILDALAQNKIEALQSKIQSLELAQAVNGVVRYPNSTSYSAGFNPFCQCGGFGNGNI